MEEEQMETLPRIVYSSIEGPGFTDAQVEPDTEPVACSWGLEERADSLTALSLSENGKSVTYRIMTLCCQRLATSILSIWLLSLFIYCLLFIFVLFRVSLYIPAASLKQFLAQPGFEFMILLSTAIVGW